MKKIVLTALLCLLVVNIEAREVLVDIVSQATPTEDWKKEGALPRCRPSRNKRSVRGTRRPPTLLRNPKRLQGSCNRSRGKNQAA